MKNLKPFFILIFIFSNIIAQDLDKWNSFTSFTNVNKITSNNEVIWAATNGGAFSFNYSENSFITLNKSVGLSSHQITSVAIDNNGFVWLGDKLGVLNIYDPETGLIQKILDIKSSNKTIKQINEISISGDTAFVSTAFGLSLVNTESLSFIETIVKLGDFTTETNVNSVFLKDVLYVCSDKGIAKQKSGYDNLSAPEAWENISLSTERKINKIAEFNNTLYAATEHGLLIEDNGVWSNFLFSGYNVKDIKIFNNEFYAVLQNSIHKIENQSATKIYSNSGYTFNNLTMVNNQFYIATDKGLFAIIDNQANIILPDSPLSNSFLNISIDNNSNVWIGTGFNGKGKGIAKFDGNEWINYSRENFDKLNTNDFFNVHTSDDGTVYFCSWGFGFTTLFEDNLETYTVQNTGMTGIPSATNFLVISDIKTDADNNAWVLNYLSGNQEALSVMTKDKTWIHYKFGSPYFSKIINTEKLIIDQYNSKWFTSIGEEAGYSDKGLYRFNENGTLENTSDDTWLKLTTSDGLHSNDITAITIDNYGELWIGTTSGLNFINNPSDNDPIIRDVSYTGKTLFESKPITCIAVDAINEKWIGTNEGVYHMNSDCSQLLENFDSENSPLPVDAIKSIAIDDNTGIIYFGTDFGLTSFQTSAQKPSTKFSELFSYPSPYIIDNSKDNRLKISGLVKNSIIKILTVSGNLVRTLETPGGGLAYWDGRNEAGGLVASGIYIILAYDEGAENSTSSKIAVIRK
ncbi:MAG: hypothetical protein JEY94_15925 [Melioribacteraceae bacterium]|nr:hypothetical protein [Melioribacteraceae bacterium]